MRNTGKTKKTMAIIEQAPAPKATKAPKATNAPKPDADVGVGYEATKAGNFATVPLAMIRANFGWNSRYLESAANQSERAEGSHGSIANLADSLEASGQDTPIIVRRNPDKKHPDTLELLAGFRRYKAHLLLEREKRCVGGDQGWLKKPTIQVTIVEASDVQARMVNLRENISREPLSPPDFAVSAFELSNTHRLTQVAIAAALGISQTYVSTLLKIARKVKPGIIASWRSAPVCVAYEKMGRLADVEAEQQDAAYQLLLGQKPKAKRTEAEIKDDEEAAITAKKKEEKEYLEERAFRAGVMWSRLAAEGLVDTEEPDFSAIIEILLGVPIRAKKALANKASDGWKHAETPGDEEN